MRSEVLRSEKGGYNKTDVLTKLDALNALLMMAEEGVDSSKILPELEKIRQRPMRKEKSGFFGTIGFSAEDTDNYIADLEAKLMNALSDR
ncbi:hypothetical protein [Ruminococcus flavefaciens]|uniref:Uncharacterized protein n=1 Tax=Ruminococcus flavefaciens TaxID=1265 RepID=A0A315Y0I0_RUMFL|nr:hypothetical protein [Ruminococcus flavefaciens]PWJ13444.1 hypothetical protein IE37_01248 [Ruminococcus flavefaciens]SSA47957.1 hypothetical protein SAMN02910325_01248 [Ruminococcus flavefaciens]